MAEGAGIDSPRHYRCVGVGVGVSIGPANLAWPQLPLLTEAELRAEPVDWRVGQVAHLAPPATAVKHV